MSTGFGFVEVLFVFGVALGLALWELVRIRRELRRSREQQRDEPPVDGTP